MTFVAPLFLAALLLVPLAVVGYIAAQRRRSRYAVRFTNLDLLANLVERRPGWRRHVPPLLYLVAIAALGVALARPHLAIAVPREEATIILTLDVSASMRATDVEPTRLAAAQRAANEFLDTLPDGVRVGIVAFSERATVLAAPTADRERLRDAIAGLAADGGTAMGDALARSLELAGTVTSAAAEPGASPAPDVGGPAPASPGGSADPGATADPRATPKPGASGEPGADEDDPLVAIVLLGDGANSVGDREPVDVAREAAAAGVPVYTVALGTASGVVELNDPFGNRDIVPVPPDRETLRAVASTTGGRFFDAPTSDELAGIYESLGSRIGFTTEEQEVTWLFAALALAFVVGGASLAVLWFNRFP